MSKRIATDELELSALFHVYNFME